MADGRSPGFPLTDDQLKHVELHLTDGCRHDECIWCLERRVHGGTGIAALDAHMLEQLRDAPGDR